MSEFRASHVLVEWISGGDGAKRASHVNAEWVSGGPGDKRVSQVITEAVSGGSGTKRASQVIVEAVGAASLRSVRIYAWDVSNTTPTTLSTWMKDKLSWGVEIRDDSNLTTDTDLADFDLIVACRLDDASTLGDDLRSKCEAAGVPYAMFGMGSGFTEGTGKTPAPEEALLTGTWEYVDNTPGVTKINVVDNTHYITETFSTGLLTILDSVDFSVAVDDGASTVGDVLADADDSHANYTTGQAALIAVEAGTDDLAGSPAATTERMFSWGLPHDFSKLNTDGDTLFQRAFTWLLSNRPQTPTISVASVGTGSVSLLSSNFVHENGDRSHTASRWQVTLDTDTTWSSVVYDSSYTSDLTSHTATGLSPDTDYMARVLHSDDLSEDSEYSTPVDFTTDDYTSGVAGYEIEFYTSGDASISTVQKTTESTTYEELIEEGISIPDTTSYFIVRPIKLGGVSAGAAIKELYVDRGSMSREFAPYPFRPEAHTDEVIHAAHNTTGASSSNALTIDWSEGRHQTHTLTENVTYTFTNMENGTYYLRTIQDSTARTVTWPGAVQWAGGTAGTVSTGNGNEDVWRFTMYDDTDIIGEEVAKNVS